MKEKGFRLKIITVGGMIGVGKTTIINNLCEVLNNSGKPTKVVYELWENKENNIYQSKATHDEVMDMLLEMYYGSIGGLQSSNQNEVLNAKFVTLTHQIHFLTTRVTKVILAIEKAKELNLEYLLIDRTIFEDIIFTKTNLFNDPLYWETYYSMWELWEARLSHELQGIDTMNIILDASFETILSRIKKRGRDLEQDEELEKYFKDLNENYIKEMEHYFILKRIHQYCVIDTELKSVDKITEEILSIK